MDREKVIKGLEICTTRPRYCTDCPYKKDCVLDSQEVMEDSIALLKEQEAEVEIEGGGSTWWYVCGECHTAINPGDKKCRECGRRLIWENTTLK